MTFSSTFNIPNQALLTWTPTAAQVGATNTFSVQVSDGRGGTYTQPTVTVTVTDTAINHAPAISSNPPLSATVGRLYSYNLTGSDPDNDPIYWSLVSGPWGMSLDPNLGTLRWLPTAIQVGPQNVTVKLVDDYGGSVNQSWTISVRGTNLAPVITSTPPTALRGGKPYFYAVQAYDPDGDPLTYSLTAFPTGMTINTPLVGLVQWLSPSGTGPFNVTVQVSDGQGGTTSQNWSLNFAVFGTNWPPAITSQPPLTAVVGTAYSYQVTYKDRDGDSQTFSLSTTYTGTGPPT